MMSFLQKFFNIMGFMKHFQCIEAEDHALSVLGDGWFYYHEGFVFVKNMSNQIFLV